MFCCSAFFGVLLVVFWFVQFFSLMNQKDEVFPGRYDKAIWAAVIVLLFVIGALLYWFWKQGYAARQHNLAEQQEQEQTVKAANDQTNKSESID